MSLLNEIIFDLNKFKIILYFKSDKEPLSVSFDKSPSRNFYFCLIALVLIEMKKIGSINYINIKNDKIKKDLEQIDRSLSDSYASSEDKNRFAKIKKAWRNNLPHLSKGLHFVVEERELVIRERKKYYECGEDECDTWSSLFDYSPKNTWFFKVALNSPNVNLSLNEVSVIFNGKKDIDAWKDFLTSLERAHKSTNDKLSLIDGTRIGPGEDASGYSEDLYDALPDLPQHAIVGRENDLKVIADKLENLISETEKRPTPKIYAIHGLPGVGKTTISIILPRNKKIQKLFRDGVLWFCLGKEPELIKQIKRYATPFVSHELLTVSSLDQAELLLRRFVNKGHYLIIVDDVWEISHLKMFLKISNDTPVLVTTRIREIPYSLDVDHNNIYKLDILSKTESIKLLYELVPEVVAKHTEECEKLIETLAGLPLAIRVAGYLLRKENDYGLSVPNLLQEIAKGKKILESRPPIEMQILTTESTTTIAALLKRSIDYLSPKARQCFAIMAYLPPKPAILTMENLKGAWQTENPNDVLRELLDLGLIETASQKGTYQIHYLMMLLASTIGDDTDGKDR